MRFFLERFGLDFTGATAPTAVMGDPGPERLFANV